MTPSPSSESEPASVTASDSDSELKVAQADPGGPGLRRPGTAAGGVRSGSGLQLLQLGYNPAVPVAQCQWGYPALPATRTRSLLTASASGRLTDTGRRVTA